MNKFWQTIVCIVYLFCQFKNKKGQNFNFESIFVIFLWLNNFKHNSHDNFIMLNQKKTKD